MKKEKIVLWLIAFFGIVITNWLAYNTGWTHCNDEKKRPIYNIVETTKWDSMLVHEKQYVCSIKLHEKIAVLVGEIAKNEKLKRFYYKFNDSTLTRFVDSLKEVQTAIDFYDLEKRKTRCSERLNDFKPHHYYRPHLP